VLGQDGEVLEASPLEGRGAVGGPKPLRGPEPIRHAATIWVWGVEVVLVRACEWVQEGALQANRFLGPSVEPGREAERSVAPGGSGLVVSVAR
jgi:hypothetical protein